MPYIAVAKGELKNLVANSLNWQEFALKKFKKFVMLKPFCLNVETKLRHTSFIRGKSLATT